MKILLLSDIHGNFPALEATINFFQETDFSAICNSGDSLVYAPFPNETMHWLQKHKVYSILGNTDRKIKKLLKGKSFTKPRKIDKRIMYTWTAENLDHGARNYLLSLKKSLQFSMSNHSIGLFHGSPEDPNEFLFPDTSQHRFAELAASCPCSIIITGHSHTPFHKIVGSTHFINPGSIGRMFDSNPAASCAVLELSKKTVKVVHYRINYPIEQTVAALQQYNMPDIYQSMYLLGRKLN
jgi:putative phosphoesterase